MPKNPDRIYRAPSMSEVDIQNEVFNSDYPVSDEEMERDSVVTQVSAEGNRRSGPPFLINKGDGTAVRLPTRVVTEVIKSFDTQLGEEAFSTVSEIPAHRVHTSDLPKVPLADIAQDVKNEFEERDHLAKAVAKGRRKRIKR